jgi:hypothetical protein
MFEPQLPPPGAVHDLAERVVDFVRRAVGIVLDYSPETLPVLDHYLAGVPDDHDEAVALVAAAAGAYFGEVTRRVLGGDWGDTDGAPSDWELTVAGSLKIAPVAFAREAILTVDTGDAVYDVPEPDRAAVEDALDQKGAVAEAEFYSLCGRLETMQLIADVLAVGKLAADRGDLD